MKQNVTISFLDSELGTSYTIHEPVPSNIAHRVVKGINSTTFGDKSCTQMYASFITHNHVWIVGSFGRGNSPCNANARCSIGHLSEQNKLRACIGRMSRGLCDCATARPTICTALWPETYNKQR